MWILFRDGGADAINAGGDAALGCLSARHGYVATQWQMHCCQHCTTYLAASAIDVPSHKVLTDKSLRSTCCLLTHFVVVALNSSPFPA